ncbi:MAG: efflux RND transporter periplasmic adaptor subunit [Verrucomicrobiota bacterium]
MKLLLPIVAAAVLAGAIGWFVRPHLSPGVERPVAGPAGDAPGIRRILYYQSPMHPWVRSDRPGKCTVCGMDLVPVREGEAPAVDGLVTLGSNAVTVVGVQTEAVRRQPLVRTLRFAGTIDDDDSRHRILSAYLDGRIEELFVNNEGAEIVAGQRLARFYSPMLLTAVREYVALRKDASAAGGPLLLSGAATRLRQLGLTDAQVLSLPTTFRETDLAVDILAPMSGTVVKRTVYAGQHVKEGEPLFELGDFTTMWFKFDAYERDLAWLRPGQAVEITTAALPGRVFTNAVAFIDPNLDAATRSAKVRVELPNPSSTVDGRAERLFRHRLFADARVRTVAPDALCLPRSAVLSSGGAPVAYVERAPGHYEARALRLGRIGDAVVEVTAGLAEGERVVTQGNLLLDSQSQIAGVPRPEEPAGDGAGPVASLKAEPAAAGPVGGPSGGVIAPGSQRAVRDFLKAADVVREALAADDLARFNVAAAALHPVVAALPDIGALPALARAGKAAHLPEAKDLPSARKSFYPLSTDLVEVVHGLRGMPDIAAAFADMTLYQCPMVKRAFPGAPKTASWIQLGGPVRNPWFGADMIDCGTELRR